MKRTRLNKNGTHSRTDKIKAVKRVNSLVKNGLTLNKARTAVASEYDVTATTVANWAKSKALDTLPVSTRTVSTITKTGNQTIKGLEVVKHRLGNVFSSLVDQDGRYTNQDATAISGIANNILGCCKQVLLERKHSEKVRRATNLSQ